MLKTIIAMMILLLFLAGSIWLQIFLSKAKNKWLGLIIPLVCFMFSMIIIFSLSMYTTTGTTMTKTINGVTITEKTPISPSDKPSMITMLATATPVFLLANIPTLIFLGIYFACREKLKLRYELDKMNVQDLE